MDSKPLLVEVSGQRYQIEGALLGRLEGPRPPPGFSCDGCTASPDHWPWQWVPFADSVDLRPACVLHDWAYRMGGSRRDRLRADARFYYNLVALGCSPWVAGFYYRRVRLWGVAHFRYREGEAPRALSRRAAIFFSRYSIPPPTVLAPPSEREIARAAGAPIRTAA